MKKPHRIAYGLLVLFPILMTACKGKGAAGAGPGADPNAVKPYQVIELSPRTAELHNEFPVTIEGQQTVEIRPRVTGYIEKIFVDEGAVVKKGQTLFQVNSDQFEQDVRSAAANVRAAQASVNTAQMEVNKVRPLVEKDIISKYELETAQYRLQSSRAALAQAQAALQNARTNLSYAYVKSPANGVIGRIPYKIGALVNSSITEPLTTVANVSNVFAYFSLNEKQILALSRNTEGTSLEAKLKRMPTVRLILPDGTLYSQPGKIEAASGLVNTQTGSLTLKATFANPLGLLRSGGTGTIRIPETIPGALLVPQKATYEIQGKRFVYVLTPEAKVVSAAITVNPSDDGQNFVVQEGLRTGDKIVIEGIAGLRDSLQIKPVPVNADSVLTRLK
ncbi:efflux RND transporter periplasmic adaptor subunit [Pedobacter sp. SYSU D00535]|uniref:efflux RND transporter periplasmic adaptor subunit n=1 Tax=Pedobacter sp. SYSU D00535 TaxID=2810308 RepID=UPI001A96098F|nr:efflux RND transporter periplasmic adaptor subunit [Pedobacter sp. SYSU D00535]